MTGCMNWSLQKSEYKSWGEVGFQFGVFSLCVLVHFDKMGSEMIGFGNSVLRVFYSLIMHLLDGGVSVILCRMYNVKVILRIKELIPM